jgi:hypothetical protein
VSLPAGEEYKFKSNVYEYEPAGVGECSSASGCVALISSGTADRESAFLDASTDGNSAFFITPAQLVTTDRDQSLDVYNARVCTQQSPCLAYPPPPPPECNTSEGCRPPATPAATFEKPLSSTVAPESGLGKIINRPGPNETPRPPKCKKSKRACQLAAALKKCHKIKKHKKRAACERSARKRYGPKKKAHHRRKK